MKYGRVKAADLRELSTQYGGYGIVIRINRWIEPAISIALCDVACVDDVFDLA